MPADTAASYARLFMLYLSIAVVIGTLVLLWLLFALVRFRQRAGAAPEDAPRTDAPTPERGTGWPVYAMALGIAAILFALSFGTIASVDFIEHPPKEADALTVKVTGFQFGWQFDYPQGIHTLNDLVVPAGKVVILDVTSKDVVHKFQINAYRIGVDATPGQTNRIWFRAPQEGVVEAHCAELCGAGGHHLMRATVTAVSPEKFTSWVAQQAAAATPAPPSQTLRVEVANASITPPSLLVAAGAEVHLEVVNQANREEAVSFDEPLNATTSRLAPGTSTWVNFTATEAWLSGKDSRRIAFGSANATHRAQGVQGFLDVVRPRVVQVELREWAITLSETRFEAGDPILFRVHNAGSNPHDLTLGTWSRRDTDKRIEAQTTALEGDATASLLVAFGEAGLYDAWCDVSGHAQLGMKTKVEVTTE